MKPIKFSILDLVAISSGDTPREAFQKSVITAVNAELSGYERYWFAEHHNILNIAGAAPAIMIGGVAAATSRLRVGSGGVMLPNHSPLVVAEQFGTLECLYPGRIDLGLGRTPGSNQQTAKAIRGNNFSVPHDFHAEIKELQGYFSSENRTGVVRAIAAEGYQTPFWILGSSTDSAKLAASLGLPYAFASHFAPGMLLQAISVYRENFSPSAILQKPYVMPCINVVMADTNDEAAILATTLQQFFRGIVTGKRQLLQPPFPNLDKVWDVNEKQAVSQMMAYSFIGGKETVKTEISEFLRVTEADELMLTTQIFDQEARNYSNKLFAEVMISL